MAEAISYAVIAINSRNIVHNDVAVDSVNGLLLHSRPLRNKILLRSIPAGVGLLHRIETRIDVTANTVVVSRLQWE
jgi:hypothetical protein